MITQLSGEDRESAIFRTLSFTIVGRGEFLKYIENMGYCIHDEDSIIESLHAMLEFKKWCDLWIILGSKVS